MSTYQSAHDQFISVNGIKYAYRRFGQNSGTPLFMHIHFRGTMDHWDPALINPIAERRPIILLDNAGVGRSEGEIPGTIAGWAQIVIELFLALGLQKVDVFGFSMGGFAAQMIALNAPKGLVRKLILAGTMPSAGEGVVAATDLAPFHKLRLAETRDEQLDAFLLSFFERSERSQAAGRASFERIHEARPGRTDYIAVRTAKRQGLASANFQNLERADEGSFNRLQELTMPVLIANGSNDVLIPTENSYVLWKRLASADAQLHLYPDSGHGFLYQYADQFSKLINDFLDLKQNVPLQSRL